MMAMRGLSSELSRDGRSAARGFGARSATLTGLRQKARRAALGLVAVVAFAACGLAEGPASGGPTGKATFALELPNSGVIEKVDYTVRITYLESTPPTATLEETYSSVTFGGELLTILPCTTGADGDGLNQVEITANIFVRGRAEPVKATAASVFTCVQNADVLVNVVLNVIDQLFGGFVDINAMVAGTLCSGKVDMKDDGWLGVCIALMTDPEFVLY